MTWLKDCLPPSLPPSLTPFLIAPSMFSNIYKTNMVNISTDINKTNIHLSREITEHKIARHIFRWKSRS
jgi:predicted permease